jgi:hypothetical protein
VEDPVDIVDSSDGDDPVDMVDSSDEENPVDKVGLLGEVVVV